MKTTKFVTAVCLSVQVRGGVRRAVGGGGLCLSVFQRRGQYRAIKSPLNSTTKEKQNEEEAEEEEEEVSMREILQVRIRQLGCCCCCNEFSQQQQLGNWPKKRADDGEKTAN